MSGVGVEISIIYSCGFMEQKSILGPDTVKFRRPCYWEL